MCIGLKVTRPEAAIADASRLVIHDIYPTFFTSESFLQSAQYYMEQKEDAHGGFKSEKKQEGKLALGVGRENITGILPLYLFKEHWSIAKRKIQPVFGLMCTLDIMGYSSEQLYTIPYLVYLKALYKLEKD